MPPSAMPSMHKITMEEPLHRGFLRRALQAFYARVRIRRLGGRGEGRALRWVQTSFSWVQDKMQAAVFDPGLVHLVNLRTVRRDLGGSEAGLRAHR